MMDDILTLFIGFRLNLFYFFPPHIFSVWNAGVCLAHYIDSHKDLVEDKYVLELGAGAGLPSFSCILNGVKHVVITDYPEENLISNIQSNVNGILSSMENLSKDSKNKATVLVF